MNEPKAPQVTPVQVLAVVGTVLGLLVSQGFISNDWERLISGIASVVVPLVWMLADAIIRHGHSKVTAAHVEATTFAESLAAQPPQPTSLVNRPVKGGAGA